MKAKKYRRGRGEGEGEGEARILSKVSEFAMQEMTQLLFIVHKPGLDGEPDKPCHIVYI